MDPKIRIILAAAGAAAGLGLAIYLGYNALGAGRTVRSADQAARAQPSPSAAPAEGPSTGQRVEIEGPPPEWMQANLERAQAYQDAFEFPDRDAARRAFEDGAGQLALDAETDDALEGVTLARRRGLIESWAAFMQPLLAGDRDSFVRTLTDMGASNPDAGGALFDRLTGYLADARLAMGAARIRSVDATRQGAVPMGMPDMPGVPGGVTAIPIMVGVMETTNDETGETTTVREMSIPFSSVFPAAAEAARNGARTAEVWAPAKLASTRGDTADLGPSMYFVLDDASGRWQPVAMRLALVSEEASSKLQSMMRSRREATQD